MASKTQGTTSREAKAAQLLAEGKVSPLLGTGITLVSGSKPGVVYQVTATGCECVDHARGHFCKHQLARQLLGAQYRQCQREVAAFGTTRVPAELHRALVNYTAATVASRAA